MTYFLGFAPPRQSAGFPVSPAASHPVVIRCKHDDFNDMLAVINVGMNKQAGRGVALIVFHVTLSHLVTRRL